MKREILVSLSGKIEIRREGKKTITSPTRAEVRKNLEKGAELKLLFAPKIKAKKRTAKQFFDWYKREMKEMKLEEKKEKMRRDFSFAKDAKNFSSYGLKKEEVKEILASLKALNSWNGWSFDDMGILKELPYEKIKEYDKLVDSWLIAKLS